MPDARSQRGGARRVPGGVRSAGGRADRRLPRNLLRRPRQAGAGTNLATRARRAPRGPRARARTARPGPGRPAGERAAVSGRDRRTQRLGRRPGPHARPARPGQRHDRQRPPHDRALVLAAPRPLHGRGRGRHPRRGARMARVRAREARGAGSPGPRGRRRARGARRAARRVATAHLGAQDIGADQRRRRPTPSRGPERARLFAPSGARGAARRAARAPRTARAPDHNDRLVPADRRDPGSSPAAAGGRARQRGLRGVPARTDRRGGRGAGAHRPRRARPRRARAQRHGRVLRRAAQRLRLLARRLGPVLREPLRKASDPVRRRLAAQADDRPLVASGAGPDRATDEGHAHRAGDDPAVVVRARRPAAQRDLHADRARHAGRGARPRGGRREAHPSRRGGAARGPAAAQGRPGRLPALGGRLLPAHGRARLQQRPRSTPTCATPNSARSSSRSPAWTPT